ncbi:MAG: nicotianamine synthase family protein [Pseudomonadota bacterium]
MQDQTGKVKDVLDEYCRLYDTLEKYAVKFSGNPFSCDPNGLSLGNPDIARAHSNMVCAMSHDFTDAETAWLVTHPEVMARRDRMWRWLSLAETAMERQYSARFDGSDLRCFEIYGNLVDVELKQLGFPHEKIALRDFESIAFVGAGPLPLSAIMIHRKTGLPVTCIDSSRDAAILGKEFIDKCGLSKGISYRHIRGDQVDYCLHPCIFIAGLAQDKESIVHRIGMSHCGNTVAIRSAMGVGSLLDKPLSSQMSELLHVCFDRHTPALPPFFNATWFSSRPFWRFTDGMSTEIIHME